MAKTKIPDKVDKGIRRFLLCSLGWETYDNLKIKIKEDYKDLDGDKLYSACAFISTGAVDPQTGNTVTISKRTTFSYCSKNKRVKFLGGSLI